MTSEPNAPSAEPLPKAYDPSAIEEKWSRYWVEQRLFDTSDPDSVAPGQAFTMLLPPPNVTGRLHMGHMLNQTEMDILTRWYRMNGHPALWLPGTDHASIATHMMVERQLAAEGTDRFAVGREAFLERAWAWKEQYGGAITEQMRRLGASVDWSREYFTMDSDLSSAVTEAFVRLYEQGLVYRGTYIVNWDPVAQTAVSDLEVDADERVGKLYEIRYPLADIEGEGLVVATTRPETLLGDVAVAVNPQDARYTALVGRHLRLPLTGRTVPVVADEWANPEFGTGAVKVTPAHDPNDYALGQRHALPSLTVLDKTARLDLPAAALGDNAEGRAARERYQGLDRFEARKRIVADLREQGLLVAEKDHIMAVPVSQRTGAVVEPRLSEQWFLRIQPLADKAMAAVREGHIRFTPEMYSKTYFEWMENIHDWCLSRQLWWGHRIPAWYCPAGHATVARTVPERCGTCGSAELRQDPDALDTWFSSGLLPASVFGWPSPNGKPTADMAAFYPTSLLVTGFDILFFWVARMVMLSTHFMLDVPMPDGSPRPLADAVPFREVYIHALVRAADGQKMSKTKGNVLDPIAMIERFGTDAVRFTLASMASPGTDIAFSEERTDGYRAFCNKIWNAARFLFMQAERIGTDGLGAEHFGGTLPAGTPLETRWIFSRLSAAAGEVERALTAYRFDEAAAALYRFFWGEFCDWYLELVKLRLDPSAPEQAQLLTLTALFTVFGATLRLLSPFMPFLTEEIWHSSPLFAALGEQAADLKSIALAGYPKASEFAADADAEDEMALLQELIVSIRAMRKEAGVPEKEAAPVRVYSSEPATVELATTHADMLSRMARVSSVEGATDPLSGASVRSTPRFDVQLIYERQVDVVAERERLTRDLAKFTKGFQAAERQLGNEGFMSKAPAHIVDGLRKQAAETRELLEKTQAALDALGPA